MPSFRLADLILRKNGMPSDDASQRELIVFLQNDGYVSRDLQTAFVKLKATGPAGNHSVTGAINIV
ncbi:hypothetical protein Pan44_23140 [Caulifigura coniformis]|uniref:Uncharacterized protein n=1 Tax=Caulifigura coniformis TaxID=2527983 RepID=A0A517SDS9_9PLAN|nr:hypothetical protein [Caulifigura coniformis]QDT54286.1 hypothetical protein Pan44_23140 [Caulifigura coniformis]